jgi:uncharacterized protein
MTPQEKIDRLNSTLPIQRLIVEAINLVESPAPFEGRAARLLEIVKEIAAPVAPLAICRRGCSHCCYQAVSITSQEAKRIAHATGRAMQNRPRTESAKAMRKRYSGKPCPFLTDGDCTIYETRPMACRLHFNMGDDPSVCDIINRPGARVTLFNVDPLNFVIAALHHNAGSIIADIREFFPSV